MIDATSTTGIILQKYNQDILNLLKTLIPFTSKETIVHDVYEELGLPSPVCHVYSGGNDMVFLSQSTVAL